MEQDTVVSLQFKHSWKVMHSSFFYARHDLTLGQFQIVGAGSLDDTFSAQAIISSKWFHNFLYSLFMICCYKSKSYYEVVSILWEFYPAKRIISILQSWLGNGKFLFQRSSASPVRYLTLLSASNKEDFGSKYVHTLRLFSAIYLHIMHTLERRGLMNCEGS